MNPPSDDDRDAEATRDWPGTRPQPTADDGEATTIVPRTSYPTPPPSPPQTWNQQQPGWTSPPPPPQTGWVPPAAPGQFSYPPESPVQQPSPRKGPRWALIGAVTVLVLALVAAGVWWFRFRADTPASTAAPATDTTTTSSAAPSTATTTTAPSTESSTVALPPPPPPPAPPIEPTALSGFLASPADVGRIVAHTDMTPRLTTKAPIHVNTVDPVQCTGAVVPGDFNVYSGSGFTGFALQNLTDGPSVHKVIQAVASFSTPEIAKTFFERQMDGWRACKTKMITLVTDDGATRATASATLGDVVDTDGIASILIIQPDKDTQCEHAQALRNNVIADVRVCSPNVGSMGRDVTALIANAIGAP